MLIRLAIALRAVGRGSSEESLELIKEHAPSVDVPLRAVIERTPGAVFKVLCDLIVSLSEYSQDPEIKEILLELGTDPRSFREAATTLEQLDFELSDRPIKAKIEEGLTILEDNGALGLESLENLGAFFTSIRLRPHQLRLTPLGTLQVGDVALDIDGLFTLQKNLAIHSVMWGRRAAFDAMGTQFGALAQTKTWNRQAGELPPVFAEADAVAIFQDWEMVQLPGVITPFVRENARRLYFGLYVIQKLMQAEWWSRFQPDLVFDSTMAETAYDPVRRSVIIGVQVAPISQIIEALLHAVDHNLMDCREFASESPGNPVNLFVGMLGPFYGDSEPRDRFARFAEHYLRIYLNQTGEPYAEIEDENDPSATQVGIVSKSFMESLVEAQHLDLTDGIERHSTLEQHNFGSAVAGAGVMIAAGAEILPGL